MIQSLQQSVQSVIDEGQIGSPVFLRYETTEYTQDIVVGVDPGNKKEGMSLMHAPIEVPDVVGGIAALTAIANNWMPDPPEQIYALDNADRTCSRR